MKSHLNENLSKGFTYASLMLNPSKRSEDKGLGVPRNTDRDELIIKLRVSER